MRKLTVTIELENDAFGVCEGSGGEGREVEAAEAARILRTLAARIDAGEQEGRAIDCNGNTCGRFSIGEEDAPCRS